MKVPGENIFIRHYFELAKEWKYFNSILVSKQSFILGRLTKAYPSLVRDFYAFLVCSDSGEFDRVDYNTVEDYNGIDLIITKGIRSYSFALCIDSVNSLNELKRKWTNRHPSAKIPDGFILLKNTKGLPADRIWLYPKQQIISQINDTIAAKVKL